MLNIIICGTPGTGKSSLVERLKSELEEFNFINLSKFALDNGCTLNYDQELESHVLDEDKLADTIEPILNSDKLNIIECVHADLITIHHVDWVFVCRTDNTKLYDRLKARGYNEEKISNNIQAEIFQTILDEVREGFDNRRITELVSNNKEDFEKNVKLVKDKIQELLDRV